MKKNITLVKNNEEKHNIATLEWLLDTESWTFSSLSFPLSLSPLLSFSLSISLPPPLSLSLSLTIYLYIYI